MKKRLAVSFIAFLAMSAISPVGAQKKAATASAQDQQGPPPFTYTVDYYGFITSSTEVGKGHNITPDEVRKSVAAGGKYILLGSPGGRKDIEPQAKAAEFAGQQVIMTASITSQRYGTGPTSDQSIEGYYAGGDRPALRADTYQIISLKPTKYDDAWSSVPDFFWRGRPDRGAQDANRSRVAGEQVQ